MTKRDILIALNEQTGLDKCQDNSDSINYRNEDWRKIQRDSIKRIFMSKLEWFVQKTGDNNITAVVKEAYDPL